MKTMKLTGFSLAIALSVGFFASCSDDDSDGGTTLPPIGGYNSADEVGSADLLAYWPLNGSSAEVKSNTAASSTVGVAYTNGAKGQGITLTNGYLGYPAISSLAGTQESITISLWANVSNNGGTGGDGRPSMFFQLSRPDNWAGNVNFMAETGWYASSVDTLVVKGYMQIKNTDGSANGQDVRNAPKPSPEDLLAGHIANANKNAGKWTHYVMTWDAPTGMFKVYANGEKISNPVWESRGGGSALPLNFFTPTRPIIGSMEPVISGTPEPWQRGMTGQLDEIRVWKKALSQADIGFLYELERAGR